MEFLPKIVYQDDNIFLARKPYGVASSWGQEECFLDIIKKYCADDNGVISDKQQASSILLRKHQISIFGEEGEYGMLNRLDTVTAGLLYFARSYEAKEKYMHIQYKQGITKTYYAQVYGRPRAQFGRITTPIYHHRDDASRMTIDTDKGRGKGQEVVTYYEVLVSEILDPRTMSKNQEPRNKNYNRLKIQITSGCRHQIRVHLASIGYPIVGDRVYMGKKMRRMINPAVNDATGEEGKIELVSAGLEIDGKENSGFQFEL